MKDVFTKGNMISIAVGTVIIGLLWLCLSRFFRRLRDNVTSPTGKKAYDIAEKICKWTFIVLVIANVFSVFPTVKTIMKSLLAGSGVVALVVSIASQDAISNIVSGIILSISKTYKVGDKIRYLDTNTVGIVQEIKMRHTVIQTFENTQLIVPNSIINKTAIENCTYNSDSKICEFLIFGLTYDSDINKAMMLITAVISKHPDYIDGRTEEEKERGEPPVRVKVIDFADSCIKVKAWMWAKDGDVAIDMKNDVLLEIKKRFDAANISFAYPHMHIVTDRK